jgi:hypothetical protein
MTIANLVTCRLLAASIAVFLLTIVAFSTSGHALAIDADRYCSAGTDVAIVGDTKPGSLLSVGDVDLTIGATTYTSSDCYGDFDPGASDAGTETGALNDIFGGISDPNKLYHLDGTGQAPSAIGLGGITFEVTTSTTSDDEGTWTVTWTDSNGLAPQNLPIYVDLVLLLNGGNNNAAYLFLGLLLPVNPTSGSGAFDIQFLNRGGNQPNVSHLTLAGRIADGPEIRQVPEPASMTLFGVGLLSLGLGWIRRGTKGRQPRTEAS